MIHGIQWADKELHVGKRLIPRNELHGGGEELGSGSCYVVKSQVINLCSGIGAALVQRVSFVTAPQAGPLTAYNLRSYSQGRQVCDVSRAWLVAASCVAHGHEGDQHECLARG